LQKQNNVPTPIAIPTSTSIFGPASKDLEFNGTTVDSLSSGLAIKNFRAEATFSAPYDASPGQWDIGFYFRNKNRATLIIIIASDKSWDLRAYDPQSGQSFAEPIQSGSVTKLNLLKGEKNILSLSAFENTGCLYVNGNFVAQLDLPLNYSGDVSAMSGYWSTSQSPGNTTRVEDFSVYSIDTLKCP